MPKNHAKGQKEKSKRFEEVLDFTKPDFTFIPKEYHEWRQQGPYLNCFSCELKHGVYIGMNKVLAGFDKKGQPILKRRVSL